MTTAATARNPRWLAGAFAAALPPVLPTLAGALAWGAAMAAGAVLALVLGDWETTRKIRTVALLFAAGGIIGFPFGLIAARFLSYRRGGEAAFAAALLCFAAFTALATGGLYALDYRTYYAEWHAETLSRVWVLQFVHTVAAAFYQFAVLGLRLFFPFGFVALLLASIWFARAR